MKKLAIGLLTVALLLGANINCYAIKIKYKGSGGIVVDGNKTKIRPESSKDVCAIVEGSLGDLIRYWFDNLLVANLAGEGVTLTAYPSGVEYHNINIIIVNASVEDLTQDNDEATVSGERIEIN